jgi:Methyl-accepting chemotaxis protein
MDQFSMLNKDLSDTDQRSAFNRSELLRVSALALLGIAGVTLVIVLILYFVIQLAWPLLLTMLIIILGAAAIAGATLLMVRTKRENWGISLFLYGFIALIVIANYFLGGLHGPIWPVLIFPVVTAGLLSTARDSVRLAVIVLLFYITFSILELNGIITPVFDVSMIPNLLHMLIFVALVMLLAVVTWQSSRSLSEALARVQEQAEALLHFNEMMMEKNIQQVELGSELSVAAAQMQLASQQQASGATEQASAVSEVSTTIEELGSTAQQIAQSSELVADAAQQTLMNLSMGQDAVDEAIRAMDRINQRVQDISARVLALGERSQQIGEIIDLIDDISDETHLLALNAAIEAAGAGEHGRRFAVVAAEVKNLANRALLAAREVRGVIAEMRQATHGAVLAAEQGAKEVEQGTALSQRAGQIMDTIVMMAERTAQSAAEISLATAQQQSASEQVVETMRDIANVARQSAAGARQTAESAALLTGIASRLHGITQSYPESS